MRCFLSIFKYFFIFLLFMSFKQDVKNLAGMLGKHAYMSVKIVDLKDKIAKLTWTSNIGSLASNAKSIENIVAESDLFILRLEIVVYDSYFSFILKVIPSHSV